MRDFIQHKKRHYYYFRGFFTRKNVPSLFFIVSFNISLKLKKKEKAFIVSFFLVSSNVKDLKFRLGS